jgi:hypothetical protein
VTNPSDSTAQPRKPRKPLPTRPKNLRDINHRAGDPHHMIWHCSCHPPSMGHEFIGDRTLKCRCGQYHHTQQAAPTVCPKLNPQITEWFEDIPIDLLPNKWHDKPAGPDKTQVLTLWKSGKRTYQPVASE